MVDQDPKYAQRRKYHKLVRDKIPSLLKSKGIPYKSHIADEGEYWAKLKLKLGEEVAEFTTEESIEEMADIFEVVHAINQAKGWSWDEVDKVRQKKFDDRGGFEKKIILEES